MDGQSNFLNSSWPMASFSKGVVSFCSSGAKTCFNRPSADAAPSVCANSVPASIAAATNTTKRFISVSLSALLATDDLLGLNRLVPGAAFGIEKPEQVLQCFRIGRIPKEGALA